MSLDSFSFGSRRCPRTGEVIRLLLVEDNNANRKLLGDYLSFCGYDVKSLESGQEFLLTLDRFRPHLVFLDLKLPGQGGYDLLATVKANSQWADVPIVVISAQAMTSCKTRALELGALQYFVKPVDLRLLDGFIQKTLSQM